MSRAVKCLRMPPLLSSIESPCLLGGSLLRAFRVICMYRQRFCLVLDAPRPLKRLGPPRAMPCAPICNVRFQTCTLPLQELAIGAEDRKLVCSGRLLKAVSAAVAQVDAALQLDATGANALNELVCQSLGIRIGICLWTLGRLRYNQIAASKGFCWC
jgi:hypothetical protein